MSRRAPSRGETAAWKQLRLLREEGFAFRREHHVGDYIADFVCLRRRLIVEVDGGVHDLPGAAAHDARRDAWLRVEGYEVLRLRDADILSERNWLGEVRAALNARPEESYRWKTAPRADVIATLPLEGGGQGGGENTERGVADDDDLDSSARVDLTLPQTPSPPGRGLKPGAC